MDRSKQIDIAKVKERLFNDADIEKLRRVYGFSVEPSTAEELAKELVNAFGQKTVDQPQARQVNNNAVFKAAVKAIGSNSRDWSTYLKKEDNIRELLNDYTPQKPFDYCTPEDCLTQRLKDCLPGLTSSSDAVAITQWASMLSSTEDWYARVRSVAQALGTHATDLRVEMDDPELMPCVAAFLADPPTRKWAGKSHLPLLYGNGDIKDWKLRGMRSVLASEFLRNLGWSGFKPDRHIVRLFELWAPDIVESCTMHAEELQRVIGRGSKDVKQFLMFSLAGVCLTPDQMTYSKVDNLLWALGAYVEKKGKESSVCYVTPRQ